MLTTIKIFLSLIVPGAGPMFANRYWAGSLVPLLGLGWVILLCTTRLITFRYGLCLLLIGLASIHLFTFLNALKHINTVANVKALAHFFVLTAVNLVIVVGSHTYKAHIFGFAFYHIPSVSMQPTLIPGDIVLVDTWHYKTNPPHVGDVIVFKSGDNKPILVKRITRTQQLSTNAEFELFVEGDNALRSIDSRSFGWVSSNNLIGKVEFIWFNFYYLERVFKKVGCYSLSLHSP